MPLTPPKLDNRDFESLFNEARARIPRYVPEWTDWNESDPGITLLQLQTWLTETILYRLNQVPDLHYIKFLQLLGVEQQPARPARADLTFVIKEKVARTASEIPIPAGQIVGVSARDLPEPVFFETDRAFWAISARLKRVIAVLGVQPQDFTQNNDSSGRTYYPFGTSPSGKNSLVLGFEAATPFSREEVGLKFLLAEEGRALLAPQVSALCGPSVQDSASPVLAWQWWNGTDWEALDITDDGTRNLTQSGQVFFRVPGQIPSVSARTDVAIAGISTDEDKFYWLRVWFVGGTYTTPPKLERVLTNTVSATAALTVRDEVVGSSDGTPNQIMRLRHFPVLAEVKPEATSSDSFGDVRRQVLPILELEVDEGSDTDPKWEVRPDFLGSGPHDAHYVLNRATGEIRFGDGRRGRIPLARQNNIIARTYRYGGGALGNVGAGTIIDLVTPIPEVDSVSNIRPAQQGQDEEPLEDTRLRAPRDLFKNRNRAVTLEDFEALARETEGALVARARAFVTEEDRTKVINVVVVPQSSDPKPVPSEVSKRLVCRYLDQRRLVTTKLRVLNPLYHDLDADVDLSIMDDADLKTVKNAVFARLTDYFHPLRGGRDGKGWPFGRDVYYSELLGEIMRVSGVLRVNDLKLKKFLRRGSDPEYFSTEGAAQAGIDQLLAAEAAAFPSACVGVDGEVIEVAQLNEEGEPQPSRFYVAAVYQCCDLPVAEGALVALRHLNISVNYLRSE